MGDCQGVAMQLLICLSDFNMWVSVAKVLPMVMRWFQYIY